MTDLKPLEELTTADDGKLVVCVDKTNKSAPEARVGKLSDIVVSKYVTHFTFTGTIAGVTRQGRVNWDGVVKYSRIV